MNVDPLAEDYVYQSTYAFAANNPIYFVDINGEGVDTIYENEETQETVEVNDGIDKTIKVSDSEFELAEAFAAVINPSPDSEGNVNLGVNEEIANGYSQFYNSVNSYDGFSLGNVKDYFLNQPKLNVISKFVGGAGALEAISGAIVKTGNLAFRAVLFP